MIVGKRKGIEPNSLMEPRMAARTGLMSLCVTLQIACLLVCDHWHPTNPGGGSASTTTRGHRGTPPGTCSCGMSIGDGSGSSDAGARRRSPAADYAAGALAGQWCMWRC